MKPDFRQHAPALPAWPLSLRALPGSRMLQAIWAWL